jgi:hypothetical protein
MRLGVLAVLLFAAFALAQEAFAATNTISKRILGDGGLATLAGLNAPGGVAVTASGGFLIADTDNNRVRFVDADFRPPAGA